VPVSRIFTLALAVIMTVQALLGLVFQDKYRDVAWIRATWFGNDWFTLTVAVPLLCVSVMRAARGSVRGLLIWLGILAYGVYNYAFYLLGAALNVFFPLYVAAGVLAALTLILALSRLDPSTVASSFSVSTPVRLAGASLVFIGVGLSTVWMALWGAYVFANRPTPVEPEAFKVVAALDLSLMVPALTSGGMLLWRRRPWGYVIATAAGMQGWLYLALLSLNSVVAIQRGLTRAPGELPIWIPLAVFTAAIAVVLLANAGRARARP
jgi:hypothetical protein